MFIFTACAYSPSPFRGERKSEKVGGGGRKVAGLRQSGQASGQGTRCCTVDALFAVFKIKPLHLLSSTHVTQIALLSIDKSTRGEAFTKPDLSEVTIAVSAAAAAHDRNVCGFRKPT
ncbi:hypothetical protein ElyMa_001004300 [Elysia marginata]|uniref:Uncharacterized protein n=1 Tax=Elysia marginata TaxID=1093978 RepID=A0AAV4HKC0_9GAST|nr:hypothetical protein ElyMa_001004300 [Elysia marginata]